MYVECLFTYYERNKLIQLTTVFPRSSYPSYIGIMGQYFLDIQYIKMKKLLGIILLILNEIPYDNYKNINKEIIYFAGSHEEAVVW